MEKETALATLQIDPTTTNHICASKFLAEHIFAAQARCSHQHDVLYIQPHVLSLLALEDAKVSALRKAILDKFKQIFVSFASNIVRNHTAKFGEL